MHAQNPKAIYLDLTMTLTLRLGLGPGFVQRLSTARKPMYGTAVRSFHRPTTAPRPSSAPSTWTRGVLARGGGVQRAYHQEIVGVPRPDQSRTRRLLLGGAVFGTTLLAINVFMNRESRDDGGMPAFERDYLTSTLVHTSLGVGIIGLTARQLVRNGVVFRIMFANPWLVGIGGLALSFATMIGTRSISPDNYVAKYTMWTAFNATQAALVAPLLVVAPAPVLAHAGLYSVGVMGALALVAATAKQEKYLYMGGPLLAGATVVLLSGLAPLVLPATAVRTLAVSQNLWLYGGLCVFGGFTLYDVQKVLHHARLAQAGILKRDPVNESISLELDFFNIFIRLVQIMGNSRKK